MCEKRIFPRLPLHIPVIIDDTEETEMKNISIGGICLITKQPIPKDSTISLKFILPGNEEFNSRGRITWSLEKSNNSCEYGIEFENFTVHDYEVVRRYITGESH